jgi:hypothetical protein
MNVVKPGSKVWIPRGEIKDAIVSCVQITSNERVLYLVTWWVGTDRKEQWLEEFEISTEQPNFIPVGFIVPKH